VKGKIRVLRNVFGSDIFALHPSFLFHHPLFIFYPSYERFLYHSFTPVFQCIYDHRLVWAFEISTPEIFSKNRLAGIDSGELVHRISGVLPDGAGQQARIPGKRRAFHAIAIESNSGSDYAGGVYCFYPPFIQE
jgi:hypothetical protein